MATEVSVRDIVTGDPIFYSTYSAARSNASTGDVISIHKNLTEQIELKDGVDIYFDPGTELIVQVIAVARVNIVSNRCTQFS